MSRTRRTDDGTYPEVEEEREKNDERARAVEETRAADTMPPSPQTLITLPLDDLLCDAQNELDSMGMNALAAGVAQARDTIADMAPKASETAPFGFAVYKEMLELLRIVLPTREVKEPNSDEEQDDLTFAMIFEIKETLLRAKATPAIPSPVEVQAAVEHEALKKANVFRESARGWARSYLFLDNADDPEAKATAPVDDDAFTMRLLWRISDKWKLAHSSACGAPPDGCTGRVTHDEFTACPVHDRK